MTGINYKTNATHNTYTTGLLVDGAFGPATAKALQFVVGTTVDGAWGPVSVKALQTMLNITVDGVQGAATVKALQTAVGASADGAWGKLTTMALQSQLNAGALYGPTYVKPTSSVPGVPTTPTSGQTPGAISIGSVQYSHNTQSGSQASWVLAALTATGTSTAWTSDINVIIANESSGNANAVNDWDLNAWGPTVGDGYPEHCSRGLMQTIPDTFGAYHQAGTSESIYDAVANICAAINYIKATYGSISNVPGIRSLNNGGAYEGY